MRTVSYETENSLETTGTGLDLSNANLRDLDLGGFNLRGAKLTHALLYGASFAGADLSGACLLCAGMERTNFSRACLQNVYLHGTAAQVCDFSGTDLSSLADATGSLFHGCNFAHAKLSHALLNGATFYQCNLSDTSFCGAKMQGATWNECHAVRSDLSGTTISQMSILKTILTDVSLKNATGDGLVLQNIDFAENLNLEGASLPGLVMKRLRGNGLRASRLTAAHSDFVNCQMQGSTFNDADLRNSRWASCQMDNASMRGLQFDGGTWQKCSLQQVDLSGASAENAVISESTLNRSTLAHSAARGLVVRDSDLNHVDFSNSYLYRSSMTGEPVRLMSMIGIDLSHSILTQSTISANLRNARLTNAKCGCTRFNDSDLSDADMMASDLRYATFIKTKTERTAWPVGAQVYIAYRCAGLKEGLQARGEFAQLELVEALEAVLSSFDPMIGNNTAPQKSHMAKPETQGG